MRTEASSEKPPPWSNPRHVQRIGLVEMAGAGEPAQHPPAHLLLHRREIFSAQRCRLGEAQLSVFAPGKHPIDDAAMEVDMWLLAGPSNVGLADPGHSAAISLVQTSTPLGLLQPTLDNIVALRIMAELEGEIGRAFGDANQQLANDGA